MYFYPAGSCAGRGLGIFQGRYRASISRAALNTITRTLFAREISASRSGSLTNRCGASRIASFTASNCDWVWRESSGLRKRYTSRTPATTLNATVITRA
ncbi:MAG: hypothetical protein MZV64_24245 [Ignavibacteriales bacterium]|nr:hypothetical protein [Ignavibacteriales bacterium]